MFSILVLDSKTMFQRIAYAWYEKSKAKQKKNQQQRTDERVGKEKKRKKKNLKQTEKILWNSEYFACILLVSVLHTICASVFSHLLLCFVIFFFFV